MLISNEKIFLKKAQQVKNLLFFRNLIQNNLMIESELASLLVEKLHYDMEPREWLKRFVIPEKMPEFKPPKRKEIGRIVKPIDGCIRMIFRMGDRDEIITLRVEPQTTD